MFCGRIFFISVKCEIDLLNVVHVGLLVSQWDKIPSYSLIHLKYICVKYLNTTVFHENTSLYSHAQNNKLTWCTRIYLKRDWDLDRHWCLENFPSLLLYILSIWVFWSIVQVSKRDFFGFSWLSFSSDSSSLNISACLRHVLIRKRKSWLTKVKHLY